MLHPYQLVKDHRTKVEVGDPGRVLDGDLDPFIKAYLMQKASGTLGQPADGLAGLTENERVESDAHLTNPVAEPISAKAVPGWVPEMNASLMPGRAFVGRACRCSR